MYKMLIYHKLILFPILSFISEFLHCIALNSNREINQKQEILRMDPSNLDIYFFQVAVTALFKVYFLYLF